MKKGVGKLIGGVILIVLGILAKVNGTSLFTYDVSGVDAAQAAAISSTGTNICVIVLVVIGAILVATYFIPKKDK